MRSRRKNSGDDLARKLERQVASGDLTVVGQLARVYERMGRGQPAFDPEVVRVLELASHELLADYTANDNVPEQNPGGHAYRARHLVAAALRLARGEEFDLAAAVAEAMRPPPPSCSACGRDGLSDVEASLVPPTCADCHRLAEESAEDRRLHAREASRGRPGRSPQWSHVSGAPSCPATCPRCGRAGNLHHEGGSHYCAECDNFTGGHMIPGCPGVEDEPEEVAQAADPLCTCAHVQSLHVGGGRCRGTGADMDPEYAIPPHEWCACTVFESGD